VFVTVRDFNPSLLFALKTLTYQSGAHYANPYQGSNTLAYYGTELITSMKCFVVK